MMAVHKTAKLPHLVLDIFNKEQWVSMSADVKGDAYKGMLEKNGQDTKSGKVRAQVSVIVKRSLSPGFSGIANPLFVADNSLMLFGDAKKMAMDLMTAIKEVV